MGRRLKRKGVYTYTWLIHTVVGTEAYTVLAIILQLNVKRGLSLWLSGTESACNAGDARLRPGLGRSLEEDMATHSRILARRIPWTEEPGGLQPIGSQRVRHD